MAKAMNIFWKTCCLTMLFCCEVLSAQTSPGRYGLKTNILYDVAATVNLGAEVVVAPRWSFDLSGNLNAWDINGHKWKHWLVQPELRYWFCNAGSGHFIGAHLLGGQYNFGNLDLGGLNFLGSDFSTLKDTRAQGWYVGAGVAYGYDWIINRHWTIEAEIGLGWVYTRYDRYPCAECGKKIESNRVHNYVGPTKAALNLIYNF